MYRTGDLGFWDDEMNLNYIGRIDNQVKICGFRVELEEIEHAILGADLDTRVHSAVIMVVDAHAKNGNQDDPTQWSKNDKRVVGFVTPQNVNLAALRAQITAILPSYMWPSQMITLSELPRTINSKADRKALMALAVSKWSANNSDGLIQPYDYKKKDEASLTATEKMISKIWKELLHLEPLFPIQKDQDFLTIGGNSVLAIRAARELASSIGRHIPVALLLRTTVLEELALAIDQYNTLSSSIARDLETESFSAYLSSSGLHTLPDNVLSNSPHLSYMEEELFYSHHASDTKQAFNTIIQFVLNGTINIQALIQSFSAIQLNNPILRSRYTIDSQGRPCRVTSDNVADARYFVGDEWNDNKMQALADTPFDLARHQLLRVVIWDRGDNKKEKDALRNVVEVAIMTHHIITDRASLSLMLESLSHHYRRVQAQTLQDGATITPSGSKQKPGSRQIGYADWARWLHTHQQTPRAQMQLQEKMAFWRKTLGSMRQIRTLPTVHRHDHLDSCNETATNLGACQHVSIPYPDECADAPYSQRLAVAATALALRAIFGISDVALAIPYTNRDDPATAGMLGLFVDRLPIRLELSSADLASANVLLDLVSSATHHAVEQQAPYARIRSQFVSTNDRFIDVLVIYNWQSDALETRLDLGPDVQVAQLSAARAARPKGTMFPLLFDYSEQRDGGLLLHVVYNPDLIPAKIVAALISLLPGLAQGLSGHKTPAHACSTDISF
ncbi:Condensation domain protein [Metarhizium guizhouense ARSEF 977]|uniref:Condensation domain protein n=1 Tax=Metarhizium guizhouense (strain ARSEF 977) TaxID=1276136 RepID=A0A0B4GF41_METGA|nr:Condensation domain protein [Metarhizium guizhouense ARSEF 977]